MAFFIYDEVNFNYLDQGTGLPFIFQHGLGGNLDHLSGLFEPQQGVRFIRMDFRAHGKTVPVNLPKTLTFDCFANDLLVLADTLELEKMVIGGVSMGAGVALNFALRYPERVCGLVLSRPAWLDLPHPKNLAILEQAGFNIKQYGVADGLIKFQQSDPYKELSSRYPGAAALLVDIFHDPLALEAVERLLQIPADAPCSSQRQWRDIEVPTLILGTHHDPIHPYEYAETLHNEIPGSVFKVITAKMVDPQLYAKETQVHLSGFLGSFLHDDASGSFTKSLI